jgi:hypothetical protein
VTAVRAGPVVERSPVRSPASEPAPRVSPTRAAPRSRHDVTSLATHAPDARGPARDVARPVSRPGEAAERAADAVAARVCGVPALPTPDIVPAAPAAPARLETLLASPGTGLPLAGPVRRRLEPHLHADLSALRVHTGTPAQQAAAALHARAFTVGRDVFLGAGESAADVPLLAHEATHVVQQRGLPRDSAPIARQPAGSGGWVPDFVLDRVRSLATGVPGYRLLTVVAGHDPLTGRNVPRDPPTLVDALLGLVPFGRDVAAWLGELDVVRDAAALLEAGLTENNLTLARITRDLEAVWDEVRVVEGVDYNVRLISRRVEALVADVLRFVRSVLDTVVGLIREAVVAVAERLLADPAVAPVWDLAKKVLRRDPLRGEDVHAPTVEILADFLLLVGQETALAQMQEHGSLQRTADWLDAQLETFGALAGELAQLFRDAWAAIQPANVAALPTTLQALAGRAVRLAQSIAAFASEVVRTVLAHVKDALLAWLSRHAHAVPGFGLLTVVIERNPFTGQPVARTAENLLAGFFALLPGGEQAYEKLAEAGVVAEAAARVESAMSRLGITVAVIAETFRAVWDSLSLDDLLAPVEAFDRVLARFGEHLQRLVEFVGVVVEVVVTLVLRAMNFPSELLASIVGNVSRALADIQRDPVAFLVNMLRALQAGLGAFFDNIVTHLVQGLSEWLFRGLGKLGISVPETLSVQSVFEVVVQVLGITAETLWTKLAARLGEDRVAALRSGLDQLQGVWSFVRDVAEGGIGVVWSFVAEQLSGLWDTLLSTARDWVLTEVVQRAATRLLSMLDPTGVMAVVNSFVAFFRAVQSAIDYLREILEIVDRYVTTLAQVAAGNLAPAAASLEQGLAAAVPVALGFLAHQVGLSNVPEKIVELIQRLRSLVDEALDWLLDQAMRLGQAALGALGLAGPEQRRDGSAVAPGSVDVTFRVLNETHRLYVDEQGYLSVNSRKKRVSQIDELGDLLDRYAALSPEAPLRERNAAIDAILDYIMRYPRVIFVISAFGARGFDDVLFRPGPHAGESLPASSRRHTEAEKDAMTSIGRRAGCHHCGNTDPKTADGRFVPDHQPPSALNVERRPQRLYPHCRTCSTLQGLAVIGYVDRGMLYADASA